MATPPPLPGQKRPLTPPPPPPCASVGQQSKASAAKPKSSSKVWLIVGLCVAGAAMITALVLWLVLYSEKSTDDYSSGDNDMAKQWLAPDEEQEPEIAFNDIEQLPGVDRRPLSGYGINSKTPFYLSLQFSGDDITGRYVNMLYGLDFPVSGTVDGTAYHLTIGRGSEESHMTVYDTGSGEFTGTWGKKHKPVELNLYSNFTPSTPDLSRLPVCMTGKFKGGGVTQDVVFRFSSDYSSGLMYFAKTGSKLALNLVSTGSYADEERYSVYSQGKNVATVSIWPADSGSVEGTLTNLDGTDFQLALRES